MTISIRGCLEIFLGLGVLLVSHASAEKPRAPDAGAQIDVGVQADPGSGGSPPSGATEKVGRARELLEEASKDSKGSRDPKDSKKLDPRYVLSRKVMLHLAETGDIDKAHKAKSDIAASDDVNELELSKELWSAFRKGPQEKKKLLALALWLAVDCLALVDKKIVRGDLDSAQQALSESKVYARDASDSLLNAEIDEKDKDLDFTIKEARNYRKALQELKSDPDRPAANFIAGRFLCLLENRWDQGLPMLKKGSDKSYSRLAAEELEPGSDLDWGLQLATSWAKTAQVASGRWKVFLLEKAHSCCALVWQEAEGVGRAKAEGLLRSIEREMEKIRVGGWTYYVQFRDAVSVTSAGLYCGNRVRIALGEKELMSGGGLKFRGVNLVACYRGRVTAVDSFDTHAKPEETARFARLIESLPRGCVVALAVGDTATDLFDSHAQSAIVSIGGKIGLLHQKSQSSYICIGFKGMPSGQAIERIDHDKRIDYPSPQ